ncbi:MAG: peptidylprolyl isomerase [Candidatus Solibacter usitatus]|nr:peptidylprolyl isomerase [Candidatus Solibacter usitatus]
MRPAGVILSVPLALLLAACSTAPEAKKEPEAAKPNPNPLGVPEVYKVKLDTSKGPIVIEVHREWAPRGADRFWELVKDGFYDQARFFRIVPNFVVQFGLAADPAKTRKWDKSLDDDPVARTNRAGAVTYAKAGRNSRTTQVFINLRSNQNLDDGGFAPFGQVTEGMGVVEKLYRGYGEQPEQEAITQRGNAYLNASFPLLDYIKTATIL